MSSEFGGFSSAIEQKAGDVATERYPEGLHGARYYPAGLRWLCAYYGYLVYANPERSENWLECFERFHKELTDQGHEL